MHQHRQGSERQRNRNYGERKWALAKRLRPVEVMA